MLKSIFGHLFLGGIFLLFGFISLSAVAFSDSIDGIPEAEVINASKRLVFYKNTYEYAFVDRSLPVITPTEKPTDEEVLSKARTIIDLLLAGPTEAEESAGIFSAFPEGTELDRLEWDGKGNLTFYFDFPAEFFRSPVNVYATGELMYEQIIKSITCLANVRGYFIMAYDEKRDDFRPLREFCLPEELQRKQTMIGAEPTTGAQPVVSNISKRQGALSGKNIYLWPGHGYTISASGGWGTQRPNCYNLCEDYINIETLAQYLARYCYNAGAYVVICRERDFNPNMVIVDNEYTSPSAGSFVSNGFTLEPAEPIEDDYSYSYSPFVSYPLTGDERPFVGVDHATVASVNATANATWIANIPEDGYYAIYVSYGHKRHYLHTHDDPVTDYVSDAHYIVKHGGGTTEFRVNQQVHQCSWVFLGEFYFYQGMNSDIGAVILDNQSNSSVGLKVSADAVRFGGGMGNVARFEGVSGFRRWEEAAKYYAQFSGAAKPIFHHYDDSSDYYNDGFTQWMWAMSLHQRNAEDAALIRFHTNGAGGTGTETFTSPLSPEFENVRSAVHDEVINDIRSGYYPGWVDRGKKYRGPYDEPPNFLFELAFHDRLYPDNTFLKDPKFRQLCARAIFQGFVKYFANKDGSVVHLLPEPPRSFMVRNTPAGIQLKWEPPETDTVGLVGDGATSYVVYLSFDGKAWDNGRETVDTEYTFTGLTPDNVYYFRTTAINEGGESFPTKTLSARVSPSGDALILIVDGYDRLDRYCLVRLDGMPSLGTIYSMELSKMNMFDNIIRHAEAMENYGVYFDSADKMAILNGWIQVDDYALVDWIMGKQGERVTDDNAVDFTFNDILRNAVQNFLLSGGSLFVSGTDIGFDLDSNADQSDPESTFFNEFLKADYVSDDLDDYWIKGAPGSVLAHIPAFRLDDGSSGLYDADSLDVISSVGGSQASMTDTSGYSMVGVQHFGIFRLVYFSFPFEAIVNKDLRNEVMRCVLNALLFGPRPTPTPIAFYFTSDREEWTSVSVPAVFAAPDFAFKPDYLKIISTTNTDCFGYWQSPEDAIPSDAGCLYRARFNVSTNITARALVPQIRLRVNSLNLQQYDCLSIESAGDAAASPDTAGTDYDLYFVPPANDTAAMLSFDLLNFNPDDAIQAELALDSVTVDRFALDWLSTPTVVQDYSFELTTDGWTTGGAPIAFSPPQYIYSSGALELRSTTNTNTFGFWGNNPADITIEAHKLYRGTFEVRTDVTNPVLLPEMRLRYNTGNLQASHTFGISSSGDGANSPGTTNTPYNRLYFLPPANCVGEDLLISFDILNFSPDDATTASLILDRAIIESLSPPGPH